MNTLQTFTYNDTSIEFELIDGEVYANATAMCRAFGKRPADWIRLPTTIRYAHAVKAKWGNLTSLAISRKGGAGSGGSTFIHEKLILKLAQWLDVEFEIFCDECVSEVIKAKNQPALPKTYKDALRELITQVEEKERLEIENRLLASQRAQDAPKVEFYNAVTGSEDTTDLGKVAKLLDLGIGRTKLFELLRQEGVLMKSNEPYQKYITMGWFRVIESNWTKPDGSQHIYLKTVAYQKGIEGIRAIVLRNKNRLRETAIQSRPVAHA